jgi:glycosyltransferase involved in cell wall biosynthesis
VGHGYDVVAVAPPDEYASRLAGLGCRYVALPMDNQGTHPGRDLFLFYRFWRLLRREQPAVFLGYTVKPNVYGSLAAHALGIPVVNNIAGLGAVFIKDSWLNRLVRALYWLALSRSVKVLFQNEDDRSLFVQGGLVREKMTDRVSGSGVDLKKFAFTPIPAAQHSTTPASRSMEYCGQGAAFTPVKIRFLLIARMLWDKGVREYVEAARHLCKRYAL